LIAVFYAPERAVRRADSLNGLLQDSAFQPDRPEKKIKKTARFPETVSNLRSLIDRMNGEAPGPAVVAKGVSPPAWILAVIPFASSERVRLTWPDPYFRRACEIFLFLALNT
jgi:hypothetical protein